MYKTLPPNYLKTPEKYFLFTNCEIGSDPVFAIYFDLLTAEQKNIFTEQRWRYERMSPDDAELAKRFNVSEIVRVFWTDGTNTALVHHVGSMQTFYASISAAPTAGIVSRGKELSDL